MPSSAGNNRSARAKVSQAGHLTGRFFPSAGKIIVKYAASMMAVFLFAVVCFGDKFWRDFGEEKKLKIFKALKTSRLLNKKVEFE
ncbi:hypothetical protein [Enterobacter asburiae]|uniref:hypothetical protein n=1 Tax=Enterobacter asburiae TaxID=61645 RepID=UPI00301D3CC9